MEGGKVLKATQNFVQCGWEKHNTSEDFLLNLHIVRLKSFIKKIDCRMYISETSYWIMNIKIAR